MEVKPGEVEEVEVTTEVTEDLVASSIKEVTVDTVWAVVNLAAEACSKVTICSNLTWRCGVGAHPEATTILNTEEVVAVVYKMVSTNKPTIRNHHLVTFPTKLAGLRRKTRWQ